MTPVHRPAEGEAWKTRLFKIIFEVDSPPGKAFAVAPVATILLSVVVVVGPLLFLIEGPEAGSGAMLPLHATAGDAAND